MTLRVYADRAYLPDGAPPFVLLFPFWGMPPEDPHDVTRGRYARWLETGPDVLSLASLDEADVAVFPADWALVERGSDAEQSARELAARAAAASIPFAIFFWSDSAEPVPVEPSLVFRTSLYRSRRRPGEHAMPAWSEDFVATYLGGELPVREKRERPVVGFCGYDTPRSSLPKRAAKRLLGRPTISSRGRVLASVEDSPLVETNIVVREAFFGGSRGPTGVVDRSVQQRVRREYVENMVASDYVLAARGAETWGPTAGNFSYRLYEVLSCGRIPIFVNTDSVLPLEDVVDWRRFTVWLEEDELERADELVRAFHDALSPSEFEELQRECRRVWEEYLSPHGFFSHLHRYLAP